MPVRAQPYYLWSGVNGRGLQDHAMESSVLTCWSNLRVQENRRQQNASRSFIICWAEAVANRSGEMAESGRSHLTRNPAFACLQTPPRTEQTRVSQLTPELTRVRCGGPAQWRWLRGKASAR
jgi:hypothetical protein